MIKPTIGRVLWYYPSPYDTLEQSSDKQPLAAIVARVWDTGLVTLMVIDPDGNTHARAHVRLVQEGDSTPPTTGSAYATWMPFQIGQARKHEPAPPADDAHVAVGSSLFSDPTKLKE